MEGERSAKEAGRDWAGVGGKPHGTRSAKIGIISGGVVVVTGHMESLGFWLRGLSVLTVKKE